MELLELLEKLVSLVAADPVTNMPEVRRKTMSQKGPAYRPSISHAVKVFETAKSIICALMKAGKPLYFDRYY